ncbi:MAG: hypothetical protein AAF802_06125 [Planctomycetota bacterium]
MSDCEPAKPFPPRPIGVTRPDVQPARRPIAHAGAVAPVSQSKTDQSPQNNNAANSLGCGGVDSVEQIATDVEQFTRDWIGRIRRLIHRSSQLVEREALLAGAIAKLNEQKGDWSKRTAERERSLKEQTERLTEAWLDVETERRKAIQGARKSAAKQRVSQVQTSQAPVAPITQATNAADPPPNESEHPIIESQATLQETAEQVADPGATNVTDNIPVPIAPIPTMGHPLQNQPISNTDTGAASRQKIEEFKRMQRAIRSSRNR